METLVRLLNRMIPMPIVAVLMLSTGSRPADAATCTVQADTYVQQSEVSKNFGTKSIIQVDNSPVQRAFIRVVVSGVGGGQQMTNARLRLRADDDDESDSGGRIHAQPGCGWSETTLTWNTQPSFAAAILDAKGPVNENQLVEST